MKEAHISRWKAQFTGRSLVKKHEISRIELHEWGKRWDCHEGLRNKVEVALLRMGSSFQEAGAGVARSKFSAE